MILADTSVWVDHLHRPDPVMYRLFHSGQILIHPAVIGELALGSVPDRGASLAILSDLPQAALAGAEEVLRLIDDWALYGTGIGYVDAHLLAAVLLTPGTRLWTRDRKLREVAKQLSLDAKLK
jgi:predicted nucleic acid-binding protein